MNTSRSSVCVTGQALAGANEERDAGPARVLDLEPKGGVRLRRRVGCDAVDRAVAVVLPSDVMSGVRLLDSAEEGKLRILDRLRVPSSRRFHRAQADHLHQVIDHDVAQRPDRIVEVAAVLDPEVLGHRDLDCRDVVPAPDGLEHRIREPEEDDLLGPHLPEVVVDPEELGLVDVLVELFRQSVRGGQVVTERLLDDDTRRLGQPRLGQPLDDGREEEGRDLEIEDRRCLPFDRLADAPIHRGIREVPLDVREPRGEAREDVLVQLLAGAHDRLARSLDKLLHRPVVHRDSDDRAIQQAALLEPVERAKGHHLRQIARDPEDHENVGLLSFPAPVGHCLISLRAPELALASYPPGRAAVITRFG